MFFDSQDCDWSDMTCYIAGSRCTKIRGLRFGSEREKEYLYAEGGLPISIQSGNKSFPGELKVTKMALDDMNRAAQVATGDPFADITDIAVDIVVSFKAKGTRALQTFTLVSVEFEKNEQGMDQGAKFGEVTIPFKALRLQAAA